MEGGIFLCSPDEIQKFGNPPFNPIPPKPLAMVLANYVYRSLILRTPVPESEAGPLTDSAGQRLTDRLPSVPGSRPGRHV